MEREKGIGVKKGEDDGRRIGLGRKGKDDEQGSDKGHIKHTIFVTY